MLPDFSQRALDLEIMDDLNMSGTELTRALDELTHINAWLGGYAVTLGGLKRLQQLGRLSPSELTLVDIGCGGGDTLRAMAQWARKQQYSWKFIGMDANAHTLAYAQSHSAAFPEIEYVQADLFSSFLADTPHDILTCNLVLHHFPDETLQSYLPLWCRQAKKGVIINDLQRHPLPYLLYQLMTRLLGASPMVGEDGSLSIRKGFTRQDWRALLRFCPEDRWQLRWRWAFRHQLVIYPNED